jgi:penicillin V acylase-like amidase (Ntn superfamily)
VYQTHPVTVNGVALRSFGDIGHRSVGMPGSTSPIDRFIQLHINLAQVAPARDYIDATTRIWNFLYKVWAQPGSEIIPVGDYKIDCYTRWALNIVMDRCNSSVTWMTDRDRTPRIIKLNECDFSPDAPQIMTPLGNYDQTIYWKREFDEYITKGLNLHRSPESSS